MVYATRKFTFSAGHRYWRPEWSAEENARVFGSLTVAHGHNYALEVTVRGEIDPRTGMVMDLGELKRVVGDAVIRRFGHADLNHDPLFPPGTIPTRMPMSELRANVALIAIRSRRRGSSVRIAPPLASSGRRLNPCSRRVNTSPSP